VREQAAKVVAQALADQQRAPAEGSAVHAAIAPSLVLIRAGAGDTAGLGSGVVASARGAILTAYHVVAGPGPIRVTFADGSTSEARVSTADQAHDIAVLTPTAPPAVIVPAVLGGGVRVGDRVYAVGHPLGLVDSLTAGVVSATGRTVKAKDQTLEGLIQFDAAVNPGNSGGPLLNRAGQVVGVVTALANPTDQPYFIGIGFAVPMSTAGGAVGGPAL
jgi:S1-C subfamily serine protease